MFNASRPALYFSPQARDQARSRSSCPSSVVRGPWSVGMGLSGLGRRPDDTWQSFRPVSPPPQHFHAGDAANEIQNITNEPAKLLKTLIFHFWNSREPVNLLKTSMIHSLCRQVTGNKKIMCRTARGISLLGATKSAIKWSSRLPGQSGCAKIKNVTNEPSIFLKKIVFHFWNSGEPSMLLIIGLLCLLSQHVSEIK